MCSIGDDALDDNPASHMMKEDYKIFSICNKCRTKPPCVVLRKKDAYCRACFIAGTTHKFKACLGKSRLIKPKDRVLVCYEVGHPSTSLLHFLRTGLDLNTPKQLRFEPIIVFIDDQYQLLVKEREDLIEKIKEQVVSFGFTFYSVSFAKYVEKTKPIDDLLSSPTEIDESDEEKIREILYKKSNKTNSLDLKRISKRQLLLDAAKYLGCKFVFTPEISVDVANQLLTDISMGRGCHIPIETGFCDDRDPDVKILRPLRAFDIKELAFYNQFNNIDHLYVKQNESNSSTAIQDLMKKFVSDLQVNFPATVTTILKTGDKLSLERNGNRTCELCKGLLPEENTFLSSEESTNFSRLVSNEEVNYNISQQERTTYLIDKFQKQPSGERDYCYACYKIILNS